MFKTFCAIAAVLLLAGCSGGGGGGGAATTTTTPSSGGGGTPATLNNYVSVTVDNGPAALQAGPNGYTSNNVAFVSVTICAPGSTTNCQTLDHVSVDTGSVGVRLIGPALNSSLLTSLTPETDASSNPVGECYQYIDGYVFGSVRYVDLYIGGANPGPGQGEKISNMPVNVLADPSSSAFSNVPASCSAVGGPNEGISVQAFGANGIIGIGVTATDCGSYCSSGTSAQLSQGNPIYYDCPASGCRTAIALPASTSAPFHQVINPVAGMAVDNNGTMLVLPSAPSTGAPSAAGTLYFGIGTQTNNGLGSAQAYTVTGSSSQLGPGFLTVTYKGTALQYSFLDSGSAGYYFEDGTITPCPSSGDLDGWYCPASPISLTPTITGLNGATVSGAFTLYSAQILFNSNNAVLPGLGGNSSVFYPNIGPSFFAQSFDYGLPFFYGRSVYTSIEGTTVNGTTAATPFFAF